MGEALLKSNVSGICGVTRRMGVPGCSSVPRHQRGKPAANSFLCGVVINCALLHNWVTGLQAGVQQKAEVDQAPLPAAWAMVQESIMFGDSKGVKGLR